MFTNDEGYNVVLFDVDGPLVKDDAELHPEETIRAIMNQEGFPEVKSELAKRICYDTLNRLAEIVSYKSNTLVIEISTWRFKGQEEVDLLNILEFYGIPVNGFTKNIREDIEENRGIECVDILSNIKVKSFVALDDWTNMIGEEYIASHLVKVDPSKGITEQNVEDAKNIMDKGIEAGFLEVVESVKNHKYWFYKDVENAGLTSDIHFEEMQGSRESLEESNFEISS
ncbi:MAG: HAD domain-containing protein [Clostridia bacterium]|jgi:hypothetical protein|nr:HAD domain-containing protein [Clostridia bacterium]